MTLFVLSLMVASLTAVESPQTSPSLSSESLGIDTEREENATLADQKNQSEAPVHTHDYCLACGRG